MEKTLKIIQSIYYTARFRLRRIFNRERELIQLLWSKSKRFSRIRTTRLLVLLVSVLLHMALLSMFIAPPSGLKTKKPKKKTTLKITLLRPAAPAPSRRKKAPPVIPPTPKQQTAPQFEPPQPEKKQQEPTQPSVFGLGDGAETSGDPQGSETGTGSEGNGREAKLLKYGGSEETENAVMLGLQWLLDHQDENGKWDADHFTKHCPRDDVCRNTGHPQYDVGTTALALTAFVAQGDELPPQWNQAAEKAVEYLISQQKPEGNFGPEKASFMYNQAMATYALTQYYQLKPEEEVREALVRSLRFITQAQQPGGGWNYTSGQNNRNDLSITAWQILAVNACRDAGFSFPEPALAQAAGCIGNLIDARKGTATYADRGIGAGKNRPGLIPAALLALLLCTGTTDTPTHRSLADVLMRNLPDPNSLSSWNYTGQSYYYWYYGSLALFYLKSAEHWKPWNRRLKETLLALQEKTGHARGSWRPEPNWIGNTGGRVYSTAIAILTLEIYYRISLAGE